MRATTACSLGLVALILLYRRRKKIIGGVILRVAGSGAELHQRPRAAEATQSLATPHDGGPDRISAEQWALFDERGFVVLPREQVFEPGELEALQVRLDDLLVGRAESTTVQLDAPMVQLRYAAAAEGTQTPGSKGTSLRYRSLESLGLDPLVEAFMRKPLFDAACQHVYGDSTPVASLRTVLSSEASRHAGGAVGVTALPWQQDRCSFLDREPLLTAHLALGPATPATERAGCVQLLLPGSHKLGLLNPGRRSGLLTEEQVTRHVAPATPLALLLRPGEVALLHSCLVRSSGPSSFGASSSGANASTEPRRDRETGRDARGPSRALSVSYMDARSRLACGARREASCPDAPLPPGCLEFPLVFARASSAKRERAARTPRLTSPAAILSRARQVLHAARGACRNMDI